MNRIKIVDDLINKLSFAFGNKNINEQERCLVQEFFAKEAKKPPHRRTNVCMISCPCYRCRPGRLSMSKINAKRPIK